MKNVSNRFSTIDIVYNKLKKNIIELVYQSDQQLVETNLAKELEVSRTPIRHALYRLELEGLITKHSNGRITVASISIEEAKEVFQVREVMEGLIAREATLQIVGADDFDLKISRLEDITMLMRNAAKTGRQQDVVYYGSNFHDLLQTYSNNKTALKVLKQIKSIIARYRRLGAYKDPKYPSMTPVEEHEKILDFIKNKDDVGAEIAMRAHINRSLETTISAISFLEF